jgi:hypothetical protein
VGVFAPATLGVDAVGGQVDLLGDQEDAAAGAAASAVGLSRTIENARLCPSGVDRFFRDSVAARIAILNEATHVGLVAGLGTRGA